jgi:transposase
LEIERIFREADEVDEAEDREYGERRGDELPPELQKASERRRRLDEAKKRIEADGLKKINVTDHEAQLMQERHGVIRPCYNGQCAVTEDGLIVAQDLVCEANDKAQMQPMVTKSREILGEAQVQVVADAGYGTYENLDYLKQVGLKGYVHDFAGEIRRILRGTAEENRYHRFNFTYEKEKDRYLCPEGKELRLFKKRRFRRQHISVYKGRECSSCSVRESCTKMKYRSISQDERTGLVLEMLERLRNEDGQAFYKRRMCTVEPVYGNIKSNLGFRQFLLRGQKKVSGEFALMCIGHNLGKLFLTTKKKAECLGKGIKGLLGEVADRLKLNSTWNFQPVF